MSHQEGVECTHLLGDQVSELGVGMAQSIDSDSGRKVQIFPVLKIPYIRAFSLYKDGGWSGVCRNHERGMLIDKCGARGVGGGIGVGKVGVPLKLTCQLYDPPSSHIAKSLILPQLSPGSPEPDWRRRPPVNSIAAGPQLVHRWKAGGLIVRPEWPRLAGLGPGMPLLTTTTTTTTEINKGRRGSGYRRSKEGLSQFHAAAYE